MKMTTTITFAYIFVATILSATKLGSVECVIGVNWGRNTAQRLIPSTVVDLLLQNGVKEARIYTSEEDILKAFVGSGINLTVTVMRPSSMNTTHEAEAWVKLKSKYIRTANISRIIFGNVPFWYGLTDNTTLPSAMSSYRNLKNALSRAGFADVKIVMPMPPSILNLDNVTRPSDAEFLDPIKEEMRTYLQWIHTSDAPFWIEFFPIYYIVQKELDMSFAFNDNRSSHVIRDVNGAVYTNVFDVVVDAFVWALRKIGAEPDLKIVVGQVGWPTDGYPGADARSAERFYKHLLPYVASNRGTPMRRRKTIDTYVHALTDENKNDPWFPFSRHWGIYRSNGEPKFKIDLSGQGRDIFPVRARGIMRMPDRWCVFNGNTSDRTAVLEQFTAACSGADCTSLVTGGSCSNLTFEQNVSYAFNMFFQAKFQKEIGCQFNRYGQVIVEDPSVGTCVFPVEPVKGQQHNIEITSDGFPTRIPEFAALIFVILLSFFWVLT